MRTYPADIFHQVNVSLWIKQSFTEEQIIALILKHEVEFVDRQMRFDLKDGHLLRFHFSDLPKRVSEMFAPEIAVQEKLWDLMLDRAEARGYLHDKPKAA